MTRIAALVKSTPESDGDRHFHPDGTLDRSAVESRLSELDEHTVEQALLGAESVPGSEVTYVTVGPESAGDALRKALAMGGDRGVHVQDDSVHGSDVHATAAVLAAVVRRLGFDLVLCGMASTDAGMGVLPSLVAEELAVAQLTYAAAVRVAGSAVEIDREGERGNETYGGALPAIVSVTDRTGEARYPSFKGIMAAKRKPVEQFRLADLGLDPSEVGAGAALTEVRMVTARASRRAGEKVADDGDAGRVLADWLATAKFV